MKHVLVTALLLIAATTHSFAVASTKILTLDPVGDHTCIAAPILLGEEQALAGLSWFNNDSTVPFPRLLIMEGVPGLPPELSQTGYILYDVRGPELAQAAVEFSTPLISSTGFVWAVWVLPPGSETSGLGDGRGPAIGLEESAGTVPFYVSGDGVSWMRWIGGQRLMVEPQVQSSAARAAAVPWVLADLVDGVGYAPPGVVFAEPEDPPAEAPAFGFDGASPNPFNPRTRIRFEIAKGSHVELSVYNIRGQRVRRLVDERLEPGSHVVSWNGTDHRGKRLASGVYYMKLQAGGFEASQRVTLVK